jgi:hypothetical protein
MEKLSHPGRFDPIFPLAAVFCARSVARGGRFVEGEERREMKVKKGEKDGTSFA